MKTDTEFEKKQWHALEIKDIATYLKSDIANGLNPDQVENRLERLGKNILPVKEKESNIIRFLKHFNDILIYVLFIAAIITFFIAHYADTVVILLVAIINATIGFIQENKAEKALDGIKDMLSPKADVIRSGARAEIDASLLTVGDIVLLKPGDRIPADLRLIRTDNLRIEESALTGESVPSEKNIMPLDKDTMLGDRLNMAFSGTTVRAGTGAGIVIGTGENTEIGKINKMMSEVNKLTTPLLKQTAEFGKTISFIIIFLGVVIYLFGHFFRDYSSKDLLLATIGLIVAAIPEGLPAILSIILAIGVQNMAKRNAIVRNLPSVETLGAVSIICSDKTGTLTKNEMTVKTIVTRNNKFEVSGLGYAPEGQILNKNEKVDFKHQPILSELISCMKICNDAELSRDEKNQWTIKGDPTEGALVTLFEKTGFPTPYTNRKSTIPFDSEYKYMATLIDHEDKGIIYIKGAPDKLLNMADLEQCVNGVQDIDREYWEDQVLDIARKGQRIIGAAYKIVDKAVDNIEHEDVHDGIVFLGITGIIDPPREEAIEAIRICHEAGITVKMITGDHADTAKAIGKEMGIGDGIKAIQGRELEVMTDKELEIAAHEYDIFARTSPEHKLRLVKALQTNGSICAMTGDGVNDAPALKTADIGIAMGIKGTEVTKEAASMVLADDNFSSIVKAVEEGRRVYDNLKKTILFILPTNGAESLLMTASILFGVAMPLTAIQILWVNMITSVTISLALAFEKVEPDAMKRPPRSPKTPLLDNYFIWRILFVSVLIGGGSLLISVHLLNMGYDEIVVRTVTLQAIVITQMFYLFNSRSKREFAFDKNFFSNKTVFAVSGILILMQLGVTYIPFMNDILATCPIKAEHWKYPIMLGLAIFVIVEIEKSVMRKIDKYKIERNK